MYSEEAAVRPRRIPLLDALRGLSIILMIAYHFAYNLMVYEYIPQHYFHNTTLRILQPIFAGSFIVLAGISSRFSRNNLKRGLYVLAAALATNIATALVLPDPLLSFQVALGFAPVPAGGIGIPVVFGILHLMAACILLYTLLDKLGITIPFVLLAAFWFTFRNTPYWPVFPGSADYFPIIPWGFLFFLGTMLGDPIREGKLPRWFYEFDIPVLPFLGRHTLVIYLAHQPVLMGIMWLLGVTPK